MLSVPLTHRIQLSWDLCTYEEWLYFIIINLLPRLTRHTLFFSQRPIIRCGQQCNTHLGCSTTHWSVIFTNSLQLVFYLSMLCRRKIPAFPKWVTIRSRRDCSFALSTRSRRSRWRVGMRCDSVDWQYNRGEWSRWCRYNQFVFGFMFRGRDRRSLDRLFRWIGIAQGFFHDWKHLVCVRYLSNHRAGHSQTACQKSLISAVAVASLDMSFMIVSGINSS